MTASILKLDPNTQKTQKNVYLLWHDTQFASFWGNPFCQATKWRLTVEQLETMKNEMFFEHSSKHRTRKQQLD